MAKTLPIYAIAVIVSCLVVRWFLEWWRLPPGLGISSPAGVIVYRHCRPSSRTTLTNTDVEFTMLAEWVARQNRNQYSRTYVSYLPDVVVDCHECEINLRDNSVVVSVKDNPRAWSQYERAVCKEDLQLRRLIINRADRDAKREKQQGEGVK